MKKEEEETDAKPAFLFSPPLEFFSNGLEHSRHISRFFSTVPEERLKKEGEKRRRRKERGKEKENK